MSNPIPSPDTSLELRGAFSWARFKNSLDDRIRSAKEPLEFIFRNQFWFLVASAATFFIPVLQNDNTLSLSWSRSASLLGFDIPVPVCTKANIYTGFVAARAFSVHPLGLLIYVPLAVMLYLKFVNQPIPSRWVFRQAAVQTGTTLLLPVLHIPLLTFVMPGFRSEWHSQSPLIVFWILLACGTALVAASYHELIKPMPASQPPSV